MADFEAAVIGAGPAGLATALALARMGVDTAVVGPAPQAQADHRTTALIGPSIQLLRNLGVWDGGSPRSEVSRPTPQSEPTPQYQAPAHAAPEGTSPAAAAAELQDLATHAAPIAAVRIADDREALLRAPEMLFRAAEIGLESFGANLPNTALVEALDAAARCAPGLHRIEARVTSLEPGPASVRLGLADGGTIDTALAVAADGRGSQAPAAAGIRVEAWDYPQAALVTTFGHSRPHAATVNELHRHMGPLTTVPLPGRRSALVWVEARATAQRLASLCDAALTAELEERLQGVLGAVGDVGPRAVHALGARRAERMGRARIALLGEAAHVVPPIGAQGLNLSLRDAAALADCLAEARTRGEDIGSDATLAAYQRARGPDVLARALSIDLLNRSLLTDLLPLEALRGLAVHAIASIAPLRHALMQQGAGLAGPLPSLMR